MIFLSIVIPIIDRDVETITKKIEEIHARVKLSHEIIIVDNREEKRDFSIDFRDAKVVSKGYNCYQFEAKRYAAGFCSGEYIWFIDSDDSIYEVDVEIDCISKQDLIVFDFVETYDPIKEFNRNYRLYGDYKGERTPFKTAKLSAETIRSYIQCFTWNKWFRRTKFKKIAEKLPQNKNIIVAEDEFWVNIFLKNIDEFLILDKIFYRHNINSGLTTQNAFTLQHLNTFLIGFDEIKQIIADNLDDEAQKAILHNTLKYLIFKIRDLKDKNQTIDFFRALRGKYSYTEIKLALIEITYDWGLNKKYMKAFNIYEFLINKE